MIQICGIHRIRFPLRFLGLLVVPGLCCGLVAVGGCGYGDGADTPPVFERKGPAYEAKDLEKLTPKQRKVIERAKIQRDS